jgi:hypothetical protein
VLVTGTSIANLIGILVARSAKVGPSVRTGGVDGTCLVAYTSAAAHGCLPRAMEMVGLGRNALRMIPCNDLGRMRLDALAQSIAVDRANGDRPFLVIGTAGTVDIGAIDELEAIADLAAGQGLWFHIDAAFGAIAALAPGCGRCWRESSEPTLSPSIFTNGRRRPTTRVVSSSATHPATWMRSVPRRPTSDARNVVWRQAGSGPATWAPTSPAASAP